MKSHHSMGRDALAMDVAVALVSLVIALALAEFLHSLLEITRVSLVFLAAVTVTASIRGARAAILAALAGVLFYRLFLDLRVGERTDLVEDVLNVAIFLVVALITGALAGRVHDEATKSRIRAGRMEALFKASRTLADEDEKAFWPAVTAALAHLSNGPALALDDASTVCGRTGDRTDTESDAIQLSRQLLESGSMEIRRQGLWSGRLLVSQTGPAGVLIWQSQDSDSENLNGIELLAELASASITRTRARQEQVRTRAAEEAAKLREALLSSISHDFRSPLAAIIGSSTSLLEYGDRFEESVREDLLLNIHHEGEKLNQFVTNLLDMTRLHSGVVQPVKESVQVASVVKAAVERLERHRGEPLRIRAQGDCDVQADNLLLEQAIYNVLDNAVKYGGSADDIEIACSANEFACRISVADRGPGLSAADRENVFTSFYFVRTTGRSKGTGLGLSIAKGFVEAMGGTIEARHRRDGDDGLEIVLELPKGR